jgi:two-component system, chemotaxis family, CheB/CheR fusion protein
MSDNVSHLPSATTSRPDRPSQEFLPKLDALHPFVERLEDGAVAVVDGRLRCHFAAGPLLAHFNLAATALAGKSVPDLLPPALAAAAVPHLQQALQGQANSREFSYLDHVFVSHAVPWPGNDDTILVFAHDVTAQRRAERALYEQQSQGRLQFAELEAIYDTAPIGLAVLDTQLRFVRINERLAAMNGVPIQDHIGRTAREIVPLVAAVADPYFRQVLDTGEPIFNVELTAETPAQPGVMRTWIEHYNPLRNERGQLIGINVVVEEVTERKQAEEALRESEERFRVALKNAPTLVYQTDLQLRYVWMYNPGQGFTVDDVLGKRDDELLPAADVRELVAFKQEVLSSGRAQRREISFRGPDGLTYDYDVTAEPLHDDAGDLLGLTVAAHDITAQKQDHRELQRLAASLEQRVAERTEQVRTLASELSRAEQRERRRMAQVLHDDVQQMLVAQQLQLHMLGADAGEEIQAGLLKLTAQLDDIVQTIRTLSVELSPPVLSSANLRDSLNWLAGHMLEQYRLHVDVEARADIVVPDGNQRELIVRLAQELLFNVVKHAGVDSARLIAREDDGQLVIRVEDDGRGFDPAGLGEQAGLATFGLHSVRERLHLFGGQFHVDSAPQAGTRLTLTLPAGHNLSP